jgi:hypothetical protein
MPFFSTRKPEEEVVEEEPTPVAEDHSKSFVDFVLPFLGCVGGRLPCLYTDLPQHVPALAYSCRQGA